MVRGQHSTNVSCFFCCTAAVVTTLVENLNEKNGVEGKRKEREPPRSIAWGRQLAFQSIIFLGEVTVPQGLALSHAVSERRSCRSPSVCSLLLSKLTGA